MAKKVLVIDDDTNVVKFVTLALTENGYDAVSAMDGMEGFEKVKAEKPDLIILDVMLPKMNGLDVCQSLRSEGNQVPIIMLTARGQEIDKVLGLKLGADDYVTKPFSFMELIARVEAVLRRAGGPATGTPPPGSVVRFSDVTIDFDRHEVDKGGDPVELTPRELRLLRFLVERRGQVVSREQLLDGVWGYDTIPFTRTVDTHIAKLRKKIEDEPSNPRFIVTVHGLGYKFTG